MAESRDLGRTDRSTYDERMKRIEVDQRRWQTCLVCFGKGKVAPNFCTFPGVTTWPSASTAPEECRSCGGRGIVR